MKSKLCIIIVTHNSQPVLARCLDCIAGQTILPDQTIIVDSGSNDPGYLEQYEAKHCSVHYRQNIGFAAANNFGVSKIEDSLEYILFMNPDCFLEPQTIESALGVIGANNEIAAFTGKLHGCDPDSGRPSGLLDSTGVFRTWYGRWYDRGQGSRDSAEFSQECQVPAICGAFMFCRAEALADELPELFDESFFMYKEDIDLCLRLAKKGWNLLYTPEVNLFHARGWARDRRTIDPRLKQLSARNEIKLNLKHRSVYIFWALAKYLLVRTTGI